MIIKKLILPATLPLILFKKITGKFGVVPNQRLGFYYFII